MFLTSGSAFAASDLDFYQRLLTRGVAHFGEGNYPAAITELRVAAFGLGEVLDEFETAHVYLAISASRLHNDSDARAAVMRVLAAQRIQSRYAALQLPASLRQEFEAIAAATLTADQRNELHRPAAASPRIVPDAPAVTSPMTPAPVPKGEPAPKAPAVEAAPAPQSQPARPPVPAVTVPRTSPAPQPSMPRPVPAPMPMPMPPTKPKPSPPPAPMPLPPPTQSSSGGTSSPRPTPAPSSPVTSMPAQRPSDAGMKSTQPARPVPPASRQAAPTLPPAAVPPPVSTTVKTTEAPLLQPRTPPSSVPAGPAVDVTKAVAEGQRALDEGDLARARERYRSALEATSIAHDAALKVGEGLYRTHDYDGAVRAFQRAGTLFRSEAQFQYYLAVSLFEIGKYADAKRELSAALPNIEVTPEVARYRTKIEGFAH